MKPLNALATFCIVAMPGRAMAHPGHLADAAGHDHWIAAAALGLAILLGVGALVRDRRHAKAERPVRGKAGKRTT
ncbi:DUF6732 family protein [Oceaniglobus indicus]|uniref:DUF6732 family protein n=1 Tax=Oceaniglobus indicus TaxID=2047749 RepID=UPI000C1A727F|nr:DUF6732 family protein [Oceaniglobus indicus]